MNSFTHPEMTPFMHHDYSVHHLADPKPQGYEHLELVLMAALAQASTGKGKERHANDLPFHDQRILSIGRLLRSADGEAYQVIKKMTEGLDMHRRGESGAAITEMLGAINYLAAIAILIAEDQHKRQKTEADLFDFADAVAESKPEMTVTIETDGNGNTRAFRSVPNSVEAVNNDSIQSATGEHSVSEVPQPASKETKIADMVATMKKVPECPAPGISPNEEQYQFALEKFHDPVMTMKHITQIMDSLYDARIGDVVLDAQDERNIATAEGCILKWQRKVYPDQVPPPAVEEPAPIEIADEEATPIQIENDPLPDGDTPQISKGDDHPREPEPEIMCPPYGETPNAEEYKKALNAFHPSKISASEIEEFVKETLAHDTRISKGYPTGKMTGRVKATLQAMREWRLEYYGTPI